MTSAAPASRTVTWSPFPELSTERCILRRICPEDAPRVFLGLSHPEVIAHYGVRYHSLEHTQVQMDWFEEIYASGTGIWWGIALRSQPEQLIGATGLNDLVIEHRRAEMGYWLLPEWWRQGLAREGVSAMLSFAFTTLQLYRIGAEADFDNEPSIQLLKKLGFRHEGVRRAFEFKNGAPLDLVQFSQLASDR